MKCKECDADADWLFLVGTMEMYTCRAHSNADLVLKDVPFGIGTVGREPFSEWAKEEHKKLVIIWEKTKGI